MEKSRENYTNAELQKIVDETYDSWDKRGEVFSLSDFEEAVIELALRENQ